MIFTSITSDAFEEKNISKDIHEMNKQIGALLSNAPPSHEIPFDILQEIRRNGGGLLPSQPNSDRAENKIVEYESRRVTIRVFNIEKPDFIYIKELRTQKNICGELYRCCWPCSCDLMNYTKVKKIKHKFKDSLKKIDVLLIDNP